MSSDKPTLVLASGSPRRSFLLKECGFDFEVRPTDAPEDFDEETPVNEIPGILAARKAEAALKHLKENELVITADTVVIFDQDILNKPKDRDEAFSMLKRLSGNTHKVLTAICLANQLSSEIIEETSWVTFYDLKEADIISYIDNYKPFDKAGSYGAQECLPPNYNPCSGNERDFLARIGKSDLLDKSKPMFTHPPLIAIQEIAGSYFNVMGLPIATLHKRLMSIINN